MLILLLLFVFLFDSSIAACVGNISQSDYDALHDLYVSTQGVSWKVSTGWSFTEAPNYLSQPCAKTPWFGLTCVAVAPICSISAISLAKNNLIGFIAPSFGNLKSLTSISIGSNHLSGTIPSELGFLTNLRTINVAINSFHGQIPNEFGLLTKLQSIDLSSNQLDGSIPDSFENLTAMYMFSLTNNFLCNSIPESVWTLPQLQTMSFSHNFLNGTISSNIGINLNYLYLESNMISGTIPTSFGKLSMLFYIQLRNNFIEGTIPSQMGLMSYTWSLHLDNNRIEGTIPSELGKLNATFEIYLANNLLGGTIPSELSKITSLYLLDFQYNSLVGTIPTEFGLLSKLYALYMNNNQLSHYLPREIVNIPYLLSIDISHNFFSGPFPTYLLDNMYFSGLSISFNYFTGYLPTFIPHANITWLNQILATTNLLSGTIPSAVINILNLRILILSNNKFSGSISDLFNVSNSPNLPPSSPGYPFLCLDFTKNYLTGTIPADLFSNSPHIVSVALSQNCFHGSLPSTICDPVNITDLVLDGLSSSQDCQFEMPYPSNMLFKGKFASRLMSGNIPECVWNMPSLAQIHLAGNGFTGSIPDIAFPRSLVNISAGNNYLTGTIPLGLQTAGQQIEYLDLSVNKLTGTLDHSFRTADDSYVNLTVNRLSGDIPPSLMTAEQVDFLDGNLFECREGNKPDNDPSSAGYVCGSYDYTIALLAWICVIMALTLAIVVLLAYIWKSGYFVNRRFTKSDDGIRISNLNQEATMRDSLEYYPKKQGFSPIQMCLHWWELSNIIATCDTNFRLPYCALFLDLILLSTKLCGVLSLLYILMLFVYVGMKWWSTDLYSTYYKQYGWTTTAAMLHGYAPTVEIGFFLLLSLAIIGYALRRFEMKFPKYLLSKPSIQRGKKNANSIIAAISRHVHGALHWKNSGSRDFIYWLSWLGTSCLSLLLQIILQLVNLGIVCAVNGLYVRAILVKNPYIAYIQVALSIFKAFWGRFYNGVIARNVIGQLGSTVFIRNSAIVNIFNMILAPCLVTALTDSRCFSSVVTGTDEYLTNYSVLVEYFSPIQSFLYTRMYFSTSIAPVFLYSYQCGSALILNYIPVLLYSYLISSFVLPFGMLSLSLLSLTSGWGSNAFIRFSVTKVGILNVRRLSEESIRGDSVSKQKYFTNGAKDVTLMPMSNQEASTSQEARDNINNSCTLDTSEHGLLAALSSPSEKLLADSASFSESYRKSSSSNEHHGDQMNTMEADHIGNDEEEAKNDDDDDDDDDHFGEYALRTTESDMQWLEQQKKMFYAEQLIATLLQHLAVILTYGLACPLLAVAVLFTASIEYVLIRLLIGRFACVSLNIASWTEISTVNPSILVRTIALMEARVAGIGKAFLNSFWLLAFVSSLYWGVMFFDMIADVSTVRLGFVISLIVIVGFSVCSSVVYYVVPHCLKSNQKSKFRLVDVNSPQINEKLCEPLMHPEEYTASSSTLVHSPVIDNDLSTNQLGEFGADEDSVIRLL